MLAQNLGDLAAGVAPHDLKSTMATKKNPDQNKIKPA